MKGYKIFNPILLYLFCLILVSCGGAGSSGLVSKIGTSTNSETNNTADPTLELEIVSGSYQFNNSSYATSCLSYKESAAYNNEGDATYWIEPTSGNVIKVLCDMTTLGGGWTLVSNRQLGTVNVEDCGVNLNAFFQNPCGDIDNITKSDSYSIGSSSIRSILNSEGEWMFKQFNSAGTFDSDDAFIIHHTASSDLFFDSIGVVNKTLVTSICDFENTNCDSSDVYFLWTGNGWWGSTKCSSGFSTGPYLGNYGYCHNGIGTTAVSNSLFGNRSGYSEAKLWNHNNGGKDYQEMIWVR